MCHTRALLQEHIAEQLKSDSLVANKGIPTLAAHVASSVWVLLILQEVCVWPRL